MRTMKQVTYCNTANRCKLKKELRRLQEQDVSLMETKMQLSDFSMVDFTNNVEATPYYLLISSIIYKIRKSYVVYEECFKSVQHHDSDPTSLTIFTKLKEIKENVLIYPTMDLFNIYLLKIEKSFRLNEDAIISNSL